MTSQHIPMASPKLTLQFQSQFGIANLMPNVDGSPLGAAYETGGTGFLLTTGSDAGYERSYHVIPVIA